MYNVLSANNIPFAKSSNASVARKSLGEITWAASSVILCLQYLTIGKLALHIRTVICALGLPIKPLSRSISVWLTVLNLPWGFISYVNRLKSCPGTRRVRSSLLHMSLPTVALCNSVRQVSFCKRVPEDYSYVFRQGPLQQGLHCESLP